MKSNLEKHSKQLEADCRESLASDRNKEIFVGQTERQKLQSEIDKLTQKIN